MLLLKWRYALPTLLGTGAAANLQNLRLVTTLVPSSLTSNKSYTSESDFTSA